MTTLRQPKFQLPRQPRAIVFDLDGTLIDSERLVKSAYFEMTRAYDVAFTDEHFLSLVGLHREANDARLLELFGREFPLAEFYEGVTSHIGDSTAALKPGALDLFSALEARSIPFALATSSGPGWVQRHFDAHDLHVRFSAVVTRDDVKNRKPHPEPYLKAATHLGFDPSDILAIEDSPTGVRSASAAGMMTVMAPDLIAPDDETRALVHCVVESLHDVREFLQI